MKILLTTVLLLLCSCAINAISMYPVRFELETDPGKETFSLITIHNDQKVPVKIFLTANEWESFHGKIEHMDGEPSWMKYDQEPFILEPGLSKKVDLSFVLPEGFKGEKSAHLYVKYVGKNSNFASQIGVPVYLMSEKGLKKKIFAENASLEKQGDKTFFFVTIKNKGNVHLRPSIFLRIKKKSFDKYIEIDGSTILKIASDWPVMPYETKEFTGEVKQLKLDPNEEYEAEIKIIYLYRNKPEKEEVRKVKVRT